MSTYRRNPPNGPLLRGVGCKVMASQAGLTVVSTSYIKSLQVEMIKLHPGVVRSINFRYENQLFVESLTGACAGTQTKFCGRSAYP